MGVRAPGHRSWYQRHLPGFLLWLPGKVQLVRSEAVTIHLTEVGRDADMEPSIPSSGWSISLRRGSP